jgi:hypothetical protein
LSCVVCLFQSMLVRADNEIEMLLITIPDTVRATLSLDLSPFQIKKEENRPLNTP